MTSNAPTLALRLILAPGEGAQIATRVRAAVAGGGADAAARAILELDNPSQFEQAER